jgi:arylsulfatase A-like enzyme
MPRLDRRKFLSMAASSAAAAPLVLRSRKARAANRRGPNILFILADDLGYADLSSYGSRDIATPSIDRIGADGVRFTQAYANSAVCSATRTALITGRYPYRLRVGLEEPLGAGSSIGLPPSHPTMPSLLKKAGYRTALLGKWHLGALPAFGPLQSGYERFFGLRSGGVDYFTHETFGRQKDLWDNDKAVEIDGYITDLLGQRSVDLIGDYARGAAPFLISLHFNAPHWPWEGPGDQAESHRLAQSGSERAIVHLDGGSPQVYRQMVERMDLQVGRVLQALRAHDLHDDTIVIFTSDNGGERFSDTWPFSGRKTELLEGGVRVPSLIRWPARIGAGRTSGQVTASMDWMPTLLAAAGASADPKYPLDGMDLLPSLTQNAAPVTRKLYWRYKQNGQRAMRDGDFKILKLGANSFLFNVVDDPLERANLKARRRDVYERMVREWNAWNAMMLPEVTESTSSGNTGSDFADRLGVGRSSGEVDDSPWPMPAP